MLLGMAALNQSQFVFQMEYIMTKKKVHFSDQLETVWQEEDSEFSKLLREYRISDVFSRQADKARAERLLAPIFDPEKRRRLLENRLANL